MYDAVVIGAGPAGLMAAKELAGRGFSVLLAEAKPTAGRKLLMAGKSGLNLTKDEGFEDFLGHYHEAADWLRPVLAEFSSADVQDWARGLGIEVFTGSSGRVFPRTMKSSPLLRAVLAQLGAQGVTLRTRWRWEGWQGGKLRFFTPDGPCEINAKATVLALGGASWSRLGSDGHWAAILQAEGVELAPFQPANVGLLVNWSDHMARFFGQPVKACALLAGGAVERGEFVISAKGLEGGGIYGISRAVRLGAKLRLDLLPHRSLEEVTARLDLPRGKMSLSNHLRKRLRLGPPHLALLQEFARPLPDSPGDLARTIKALPVPHAGLRPLDEAISTAGGVKRTALNERLMLTPLPGVFSAGEMLDWEAPTGGYLMNACLATGRWAGRGAADWLAQNR